MSRLFTFLILMLLAACGDKMKSTSEVDPLFGSQTLGQRYGDGNHNIVRLKIPLTQDTMGHYDYSKVVEDETVNKINKSFFQDLAVSLKHTMFNWGVGMGISNRVRYTTDFEVPKISPKYFDIIQSIKINRIFFSLMPCDRNEKNCLTRTEQYPVSFAFLEKFFVNISLIGEVDDLSFIKEPLVFLGQGDFDDIAKRSFRQIPLEFHNLKREDGQILDDYFRDVNLAKFHNAKKMEDYERNVRDDGKIFLLHMQSGHVEMIKRLKSPAFQSIVLDQTLIGQTVFVELKHKSMRAAFFELLRGTGKSFKQLGIESFTGCSYVNCISPSVNPINFVPLFQQSNYLKLDTYMSIRHLDYNDFKYKGFVEFEIKLKLPI